MAVLYVLKVDEFKPLLDYAEAAEDLSISNHGAYQKIKTDGVLIIPRVATGLDPAIWFGALVGGFEGAIEEFSEDTLRIV
ncbi:MAG: hypothetical protein VB913_17540 [Rhodospirillales bacterium]|jgi:hypothetical protein